MVIFGRRITTWKVEASVVGAILALTVLVTGSDWKEWIGALAVFFSFMHAKIADRMAEKQAEMEKPTVSCHDKLLPYFVTKESLWFMYFALSQTWSALVGVVIFLLYPVWRRYYRRNGWFQGPHGR